MTCLSISNMQSKELQLTLSSISLLSPLLLHTTSAMAPSHPCHVRSSSLPSGSHPVAIRAEEELRRLTSSMASSSSLTPERMCDGLKQLGGLYESTKELICLTSCRRSLIDRSQKKWVEEESDESIRLLDLCSAVKDCLTEKKDHIQAIKFALRIRDSKLIMNKVNDYIRFGRKADKEIKSCFRSLKQIEDKHISDSEISTTITILKEVKAVTISYLRVVSSFSTRQTTIPKSSKWSFFRKATSKSKEASEGVLEEAGNAVANLGIFSSCASSSKDVDVERVVNAQSQLQTLEGSIEGLEIGIDCLFRQLIQVRVSLLNLINP